MGKSGDEGIDGIIKEDKLGLDVIYIQAKRWQGNVSRPKIQKFMGALAGHRAKKGVFIARSSFTAEARAYVKGIDAKIVLIDGQELASLMIERVERSFAHVCDTGGMRRSWLTGTIDVTKRYRVAAAAHNLARNMRKLFGIGKPKALQGSSALVMLAYLLVRACPSAFMRPLELLNAFIDRCMLRRPGAAPS